MKKLAGNFLPFFGALFLGRLPGRAINYAIVFLGIDVLWSTSLAIHLMISATVFAIIWALATTFLFAKFKGHAFSTKLFAALALLLVSGALLGLYLVIYGHITPIEILFLMPVEFGIGLYLASRSSTDLPSQG